MDTTIIIVIAVVVLCISSSIGVGVFMMNSSEKESADTKSADTKSADTKSADTKSADTKSADTKSTTTPPSAPPPPPPDCPDVGFGTGKPGITKIEQDCRLGPGYSGKLIRICTAQGQWIDDNQCVSSGNSDLIDISGDWKMMYGGNMGTAKITKVDSTTWNVTTSGNDTPGQQLPKGTTTIKYENNKGYSYNRNQPAKFTDSTYKKLDGGNYYFQKV